MSVVMNGIAVVLIAYECPVPSGMLDNLASKVPILEEVEASLEVEI